MTSERLVGLFESECRSAQRTGKRRKEKHRTTFLKVYQNNLAQPFLGLISVIEKYNEETEEGKRGGGGVRARNAVRGGGLSDAVFEVVRTVGRETNGQGKIDKVEKNTMKIRKGTKSV